MGTRELTQGITALAALNEPVRQSLYFYVVNRQDDVSRDEAARETGMSRALAGFHLDRLVEEGLLEASFRRLSGRSGPGAGRPSKLYRRSARQLEVSLPGRRYELAARILAGAIDTSDTRQAAALNSTARTIGRGIGSDAKAVVGARASRKRRLAEAANALTALGYEPDFSPGEVRLRNCPFHALIANHLELVCGMNLALLEGVVEGADLPGVTPVLDPKPGMCCVALRLTARRAKASGSAPKS